MKTETFEHIRTAEEVAADHHREALKRDQVLSDPAENTLVAMLASMATEIAAGELAQAMLRKRIRELENELALFLGRAGIRKVSAGSQPETTA